jgi:hypothetical protein
MPKYNYSQQHLKILFITSYKRSVVVYISITILGAPLDDGRLQKKTDVYKWLHSTL